MERVYVFMCFYIIIIILGILLAVACIVMSGRLLTGLSSEGGKESVQVVFLGDSIYIRMKRI